MRHPATPPTFLVALLLASGCIENSFGGKDDTPAFSDIGADDSGLDTDVTDAEEEACNGVDDDGDGAVDEGYPDADANGRVDCLDVTCPTLDLGSAGTVDITEGCDGTVVVDTGKVADPWAVRVLWSYVAPATSVGYSGSVAMPAVANLDDDNGDGATDDLDQPDVVVVLLAGGLVAIDGATGVEKWRIGGIDGEAGVVVGDVDADGSPDIITGTTGRRVVALEADGTLKWTADTAGSPFHFVQPVLADLDGDGLPEVLDDDMVFNGADGTLKFGLYQAITSSTFRMPAVGDFDQDGDQEIAFAGKLFDSDGTELWDGGIAHWYGLWPVVIQADTDDEAEIAFVGQTLGLFDADGTLRFEVAYDNRTNPGPPCAGDFDGDGAAEIVFASEDTLYQYGLDGAERWRTTIEDSSGLSACSGWDVDNDGALEILYADQQRFVIFDGATGTERFSDNDHDSQTLFDYPTVADLDGDGHSEILVVNDSLATDIAVTAYTHDGLGWPPTGPAWAVHDYAGTNIALDNSVPATPAASWLNGNVYRARGGEDAAPRADLAVRILDQCVADCTYGPVEVVVQVTNYGGRDVPAGAELTLYAEDRAGLRLVATVVLPEVPAGTRLEGVAVSLLPSDVGEVGWVARVDEGTRYTECDETNNEDRWVDGVCP